ncbi:SpoIIE family protein phosphatase [Bordetella sp. 15P40C-2]|nr:SpoIIE family protein phosphatase [Bordetella sp. 15P40C-2]
MPFQSLHNKIFVMVTSILVAVAVTVMLTSRRNVTDTVVTSVQHAITNVLQLVRHELAARWSTMLDTKIAIVRNGRRQLLQTGEIIETTLQSYASLVDRGIITEAAAQDMARDWINQLHFDDDRYAFVFDHDDIVLASGSTPMIGRSLSKLRDYKNRLLAESVRAESRDTGYSFAIYRRPSAPEDPENRDGASTSPTDDDHARYAYFGYFRPWQWVYAVSDSAADVVEQIKDHRTEMEESVRKSLLPLKLIHSGFVFIMAEDGRFIARPPDAHAQLLDGRTDNGQTLRQRLIAPRRELHAVQVTDGADVWQVESVYYAPLRWKIIAAVPEQDLSTPAHVLLRSQAATFGIMLMIALLIAWFFSVHLVRPLRRLTAFARQLPEQALQPKTAVPRHIARLPTLHRDEVGRLAEAFLYMDSKLRDNITQLMHETTVRERFESELNVARSIQLALLPPPPDEAQRQHIDLHAHMRPAKEVGGDLYDYFSLPDGKLCFVIGDVSDKGVPAALFMAITRTLIRAAAEDESHPARIVQKVNDRLAENNPSMMFVTLLLGVLDVQDGSLIWVNAGHLEPYVLTECGVVRALCGRSGPACGVQADNEYITYQSTLLPGDTLVGYTDGVTESMNRQGEQFGDERLVQALASSSRRGSLLIDTLLADTDAFTDGADQADDITLLVVQRT